MGNHYIPQEYLRGFSNDRKIIWRYDKAKNNIDTADIESVLQKKNLYTEELENSMTRALENPANAVMRSIQKREKICTQDRKRLANYIFLTLIRGPLGKRQTKSMIPGAANHVEQKLLHELNENLISGIIGSTEFEERKKLYKEIIEQQANEKQVEIWHKVIHPEKEWRAPRDLLQSMGWTIYNFEKDTQIFTSDYPLTYNKNGFGFGDRNVKLQFPISSSTLLQMDWDSIGSLRYKRGSKKLAEAFNRNLVKSANRLVIFKNKEAWMEKFFNKNK